MEALLKAQYLAQVPSARLAFSRPGIVTFKLPAPSPPASRIAEKADLADAPTGLLQRTYGRSIANVQVADAAAATPPAGSPPRFGVKQFAALVRDPSPFGQDPPSLELIQRAVAILQQRSALQQRPAPAWDLLHFWVRDGLLPAWQMGRGTEPDVPAGLQQFAAALHAALVAQTLLGDSTAWNLIAAAGQRVLDVCLVGPHQLLLGEHVVRQSFQKWPGGVMPLVPTNPPPISRAYFKVREAVSWAELRIRPGQRAVEIGAAPGGSCQWLLEQGLLVTGIDPAEIDPAIAQHPNFTHVRRRGREVKRRDLFHCDWLLSDANLPPNYILATLDDLLAHPRVAPQGLILTLKLPDTRLLEHWNEWSDKVRSWGYQAIGGRQLIYNRQEICLVATRGPR